MRITPGPAVDSPWAVGPLLASVDALAAAGERDYALWVLVEDRAHPDGQVRPCSEYRCAEHKDEPPTDAEA